MYNYTHNQDDYLLPLIYSNTVLMLSLFLATPYLRGRIMWSEPHKRSFHRHLFSLHGATKVRQFNSASLIEY